jgi:hypothetical protein
MNGWIGAYEQSWIEEANSQDDGTSFDIPVKKEYQVSERLLNKIKEDLEGEGKQCSFYHENGKLTKVHCERELFVLKTK